MNIDLKRKKKVFLTKKKRQNRRVPMFATIRTKRAVGDNPKRRNWRTRKLKMSRKKLKRR